MAYDEALADRVRDLVTGPGVTEKRMFGGLAFLLAGRLAVAASSRGGLMVRVDPAAAEGLLAEPGTEQVVMRGSAMRGWIWVDSAAVEDEGALEVWIGRGTAYAGSLPAKP